MSEQIERDMLHFHHTDSKYNTAPRNNIWQSYTLTIHYNPVK